MVVQRAMVPYRDTRYASDVVRARYNMLDHLRVSCRRYGAALVAFGFDDEGLRLVLQGDEASLMSVWRSIWFTVSGRRSRKVVGPEIETIDERSVAAAVIWAHRGPIVSEGLPGPLATPWSSHRDLLGYRRAPFYDRGVLTGRVDLTEIHRACGGGPPPTAAELRRDCCARPRPRGHDGPREPLLHLSRVAGSVLGREPADPKCFGLFAHLACARGWSVREVADALLVSTRRVRQLLDVQARELELAYTALFHPETVGRLP